MYYVADTGALVRDGVLDESQAEVIHARAREAMVALSLNTLLVFGIIAATLGLVFWLASPLGVAIFGVLAIAAGVAILVKGSELYRMFGNASALIGAGMLAAGAGLELVDKYEGVATPMMIALGAGMTAIAGYAFTKAAPHLRFATGAVTLMGVALTIGGIYFGATFYEVSGLALPAIHLLVFAMLVAAGLFVDLRLVTALAIVPFSQALETGTFYYHAMYAFYSPEPTFSILQMGALIAACLWLGHKAAPRVKRQTGILAIMAFVVANLCFLVGSLWGDVLGETMWGPVYESQGYDVYAAERDAFRAAAIHISEHVFSIVWAVLLAGAAFWAAMGNKRGLFNTAITFGGIHAYTQMFESFGDEPLAYVIGGLAAIPLAWGLWRLNDRFRTPVQVM